MQVLQSVTKWNIFKNIEEDAQTSQLQPPTCRLSAVSDNSTNGESRLSSGPTSPSSVHQNTVFLSGRVLCVSAEWEHFPLVSCSCQQGNVNQMLQFDIIFCSEGVYRKQSFQTLASLMKDLLKPDGVALIASKRLVACS